MFHSDPDDFKMDKTIYKNHIATKKIEVAYADIFGPPSSPPMTLLLITSVIRATIATEIKTATENAKLPAGVM